MEGGTCFLFSLGGLGRHQLIKPEKYMFYMYCKKYSNILTFFCLQL